LSQGGATIIAVSGDKHATQAKFRAAIGAEFSFVSDSKGALMSLFGVKLPVVKLAKRATFVIGKERKILHVETGKAAIGTDGAAEACSLY